MTTQPKLDTFTKAYVATLMWSETDEDTGESFLRGERGLHDIEPGSLAVIIADCERFQREQFATLSAAIDTGQVVYGPDLHDEWERAGHDFCLTRNGHGAGFWDGDWPAPYGDQLTVACKAYAPMSLYVGDDGKLYTFQG